MTYRRRSIVLAAIVAAAAVGAAAARAFHVVRDIEVTFAPVTRGTIARTIVATGTLEPVETVQVGAQISGTIEALYADYNTVVHRGQILATLETAQLDAELHAAEAALGGAQAALDQAAAARNGLEAAALDARTKLTREEALAGRNLVPASDLDAARTASSLAIAGLAAGDSQVAVARDGVEQARALVRQAQVNRARAVITSPIDGIVVARNVDVGQTVAATVQAPVLFAIAADMRRMQMEVDVDETDIGGIEIGTPVTFDVESYPEAFTGTIASVRLQPVAEQTATATTVGVPEATSTTVASVIGYATIVDVENADGRLRPGMTATVTLRGARVERALRIPNAALSFRPPADAPGADDQSMLPDRITPGGTVDVRSARRVVWRYDRSRFAPIDLRTGMTDRRWTEVLGDAPVHEGDLLVTGASIDVHSALR